MQLFSADNFFSFFAHENMKKTASKVVHNQHNFFFSVMLTGPNPAQFSVPVPQKYPTAGLFYNDFSILSWKIDPLN